MFAKLVVIDGPDRGKWFEAVPAVQQILGRSREADMRLNDLRVSRYHCRFEVRNDMLFVTDLDSTTGTSVNNVFILEQPVQYGDSIGVGDTTILVLDPDAPLPKLPKAELAPAPERKSNKPSPAETGKTVGLKAVPAAKPKPTLPSLPPVPVAAAKPLLQAVPLPDPAGDAKSELPERIEQLTDHDLGAFRVGQLIARANSGLVFRGHMLKSGKEVAIKVMYPTFAQSERNKNDFAAAMKRVIGLKHDNITSVISAGKNGPYCWMAMDLVTDSLTGFIRKYGVAGSLDWRRALKMAVHLSRGLEYLHEQKLAYRAMGPQNILVDFDTRVPKFSDFVRSRPFFDPVNSEEGQEMPEALMLYMAPEQTREQSEVDSRSDIFNLGSMVYSLLSGRPPFEGGSLAETITKIRREKPEVPKKYQLAIPEAFQGVVLQMLAKRPEDRYQTIIEVRRELERVLKYQGMTLD